MRPTLEALEDRFAPAVLTVTSLADSGAGSLRSLVAQANSDSSFAGQADTIQFAPYLSGTITLGTPLGLTSRAGVEIDGSPTITLSGGGNSEVFQVYAGATVSLNGLTITNGSAAYGGAIFNAGSLTLNGDLLSANAASDGGGIYNVGALTLYASTLWGNAATNGGGGIYNQGTLTLDASTLAYNSATFGGGLYNDTTGNAVVQDNCNLSGNTATGDGGAIYNLSQLSISGGTLWSNAAYDFGGAIYNGGTGSMYVAGANLSYNTVTIGDGGAIYNESGTSVWIDGSVLVSNSAVRGGAVANNGQLTLSSDWLTSNTAVQGGGIWNSGTLAMTGDNVSYNSLRFATASDLDPNLQPLGSGLYNYAYPGGTVSLDGSTFIGNNFNPDGSWGGDLYGV
jgi:predicted outer membrane repeat protein